MKVENIDTVSVRYHPGAGAPPADMEENQTAEIEPLSESVQLPGVKLVLHLKEHAISDAEGMRYVGLILKA